MAGQKRSATGISGNDRTIPVGTDCATNKHIPSGNHQVTSLDKPSSRTRMITPKHLERIYIFALLWSIGAFLEGVDRAKLESFLRKHETVKFDLPEYLSDSNNDTIFDYVVSDSGEWIHWNTKVEEFHYPTDSTPEYSSLLVPNVDNVRTEFLIDLIAKQQKCVLLIGEQVSSGHCKSFLSYF
ncbi:unnamed protein product [Trichobilharzia regenti]|nr:unnamed protein product [Trichobilharzia regenti]